MQTRLFLSGEIQGDVGDAYHHASKEVESAVNAVIRETSYGEPLAEIALIPILLKENDPDYPEVKKYWKKKRTFEYRLKIPHAEFKAADAQGQRTMIVANILRAVSEMRNRKPKIPGIDCDKLEGDIRAAAAAHGWLPSDTLLARHRLLAETAPVLQRYVSAITTELWIAGEGDVRKGDAFDAAAYDVQTAIGPAIADIDYGEPLRELALTPLVVPLKATGYRERKQYDKKDRRFSYRLKLPLGELDAADAQGQRKLIVANLLRAVSEMRNRKPQIPGIDYDRLEGDIRAAAEAKGWL